MSRYVRHPYEIASMMQVHAHVEETREMVTVQPLTPTLRLPTPDSISNAWMLKTNYDFTVESKTTYTYNTGLQFTLPAGLVGTVSAHPRDHREAYIPVVETVCLYEHLPFVTLTLRLTNGTMDAAHVPKGHPLALISFHRTSMVELEVMEPTGGIVGEFIHRLVRPALTTTAAPGWTGEASDEEDRVNPGWRLREQLRRGWRQSPAVTPAAGPSPANGETPSR